ncbi:MAG: nucleoside 2-deoxyribosyltransferase domain-containing protein [Candidatus Woesearchaeota archaeon]
MRYIEAPTTYSGTEKSLFLGGGITGCPNWQASLCSLLRDEDIVLLNPRRAKFPIEDKNAKKDQILWEFEHLRKAYAISFWFPRESVCPIALYELGAWSMTNKQLFVGMDSKYNRRVDVEIQTKLFRPELEVVYSMDALAERIKVWIRQ